MASKKRKMSLCYRPVGMVLGIGGGMIAGALFGRAWKVVGDGREAPDPLDDERAWREVLTAAALHGAIFAVVKAAVDRGGAEGVRRITGRWPA
ncbi:DUF4235 domain-containing protein [Streptomyces sp. NBC_01465]|uniref:DUF4235 domain-containing protein n=1 Tax=Streptomyces sp. NBC_01465 TaxID=2903878 RepID=UPI002E300944|nr:DUF4235 domain-containing protein [Streptomyces sp. NBC_01465]